VNINFPALTPTIFSVCIRGESVVLRAGSQLQLYDGSITFKNNQLSAFVRPITFDIGADCSLVRVYAPGSGCGLDGHFQLVNGGLILEVDEIGDVLQSSTFLGNQPACWRLHLRREWADCD
jgi:hypothetical protein